MTTVTSTEIIDLTSSPTQLQKPISSDSSDIQLLDDVDSQVNNLPQKEKDQQKGKDFEDGELMEATKNSSQGNKQRRTITKPRRDRHRSRSRERGKASNGRSGRGESRRGESSREHRTRRRSLSRDRLSPPSRRRSHSPGRRRHHQSRSPEVRPDDDSPLFYIDVKPVPVPEQVIQKDTTTNTTSSNLETHTLALLLPTHVSVMASDVIPVEIHSPTNSNHDENEDDYIDYLDYDDDRRAGIIRYFDEANLESKHTRLVCKHCGAEGEHKTRDCPVLICLTCGARDEHSTRSCPISKTCYTCGMRGHINKNCPNRYSSQNGNMPHNDCNRCGSSSHRTNECPTLWRIYEFLTDQERDTVLHAREKKRDLAIGHGGEGYIGPDDWCYNCGECGHFGDDCTVLPHPPDFPREPSAFSEYNIRSGPFFDLAAESMKKRVRSRKKRDWEVEGPEVPTEVGKRGRKKERDRMEKIAREQDEEDEIDWFNNPRNVKNRGVRQTVRAKGKSVNIELAVKDGGKRFSGGPPPSSAPGLLARLSDRYDSPSSSSRQTKGHRERHRNRERYSNGHENDDSRTRDQPRRSKDWPKWTGGYS